MDAVVKSTRLFGRDQECLALAEFARTESGLFLVSGEAGIGKTRLTQEAIATSGSRAVWGRPEQVSRPGPFALIWDLVEDIIDKLNDPSTATVHSLREAADLIRGTALESETDLPLRRLAAQIRGAISEVGSHPVVVLEDLHQADDASLSVLLMLTRSAQDDDRALIGTYRDDEVAGNTGLGRFLDVLTRERLVRELRLQPLDDAASEALARDVLGSAAPPGLLRRLLSMGEGIPFFLEELADSAIHESAHLPKSVSRAAHSRLERLGPSASHIVRAAAILAGAVDADVLSQALEVERSAATRALVDGFRAGLLTERDGKLVFRHGLVRESLLDEMTELERRDLHTRVAVAIETLYEETLELHEPSLAIHWYEARVRRKALHYSLLAGHRALAMGATADARHSFELALASTESSLEAPEALEGLAEVSRREGNLEEATDLYSRASGRYRELGKMDKASEALADSAWMKWLNRRDSAVLGLLDDAIREESKTNVSLRASMLARKGKVLVALERLEEAESVLNEAFIVAQKGGEHRIQADVAEALAFLSDWRNDRSRSHSYFEAACYHALLADSPELIGRTHNNRALALILKEDIAQGLQVLGVANAHLERASLIGGLSIVRLTEAIARWRLGDPVHVEESIGRTAMSGTIFRGWAQILRAWASVHLGEVQRAIQIVSSGWAEVGLSPDIVEAELRSETVAEVALCEVVVSNELNNPKGFRVADAVVAYYARRTDETILVNSLSARAAVLAREYERAESYLEIGSKILDAIPSAYLHAHVSESEGLLASARGDFDRASERYRNASQILIGFDNFVDSARCLRLYVEVELASHGKRIERDAAVMLLRQALDLATKSGAIDETSRVEASLRALGVRPRAGRPRKQHEDSSGRLSPREEQIASLVAAGATNSEIASSLYLSDRTVQDHITHALRKLKLPGRAALAAWAVRNRLI